MPFYSGVVTTVYNFATAGKVNGPPQNTANETKLCARQPNDRVPAAIINAPCFLPNLLAGDYWVVAIGPSPASYEWAIISAGQPTVQYKDGCTTKTTVCVPTNTFPAPSCPPRQTRTHLHMPARAPLVFFARKQYGYLRTFPSRAREANSARAAVAACLTRRWLSKRPLCGCCQQGTNGAGLWLFTRDAMPSKDVVPMMRQQLVTMGYTLDQLIDVPQQGCTYQGALIKK